MDVCRLKQRSSTLYRTNDLYTVLKESLEAHDNILISGPPGIGKSEITYQVCEELGLRMYETRLYEQGETAVGLPIIDSSKGVTRFTKPFWFHELETGSFDVLFLDDFHLVVPGIQKYLYRTLTSRMLHDYKLSKGIKIIVAGNFSIDSADASPIQSPIMSRFDLAIKYEPTIDTFLNWALKSPRFDTRVLAFLKSNPDLLYTSDPPTSEMFPCPRTWEYVSREISATNKPDKVTGIVGERAGAIFQEFWALLDRDPEEILRQDPNFMEAQELVASAFILARYFVDKWGDEKKEAQILNFVGRYPKDILFLFARTVTSKLSTQFIRKLQSKSEYKHIVDVLLDIADRLGIGG